MMCNTIPHWKRLGTYFVKPLAELAMPYPQTNGRGSDNEVNINMLCQLYFSKNSNS